jgi:hypothetical protein
MSATGLNLHNDRQYVECDYSQFDCSYGPECLAFVAWFYERCGLPMEPGTDFRKVFDFWSKPKGTTQYGDHYQAKPMNASGRDDTALMNALLNGLVQAFSWFCHWVDLPHDRACLSRPALLTAFIYKFDIAVLGDDSITVGPKRNQHGHQISVAGVERTISLSGFECKIKVHEKFSHFVYLGNRPWCTTQGPVWGPTLGRRLYKHHFQRVGRRPYSWLEGIVHFESKDYGYLPILGPMARRAHFLLQRGGVKRGYVNFREVRFHHRGEHLRPEQNEHTLAQFTEIYGASVEALQHLEHEISQVERLPCYVCHPVMDRIFEVDDL